MKRYRIKIFWIKFWPFFNKVHLWTQNHIGIFEKNLTVTRNLWYFMNGSLLQHMKYRNKLIVICLTNIKTITKFWIAQNMFTNLLCLFSDWVLYLFSAKMDPFTAWKVSVFGVILVRIFPHSDQNNSISGHFLRSVFS